MKTIIAEQITKVYPGGKRALNAVDFSIEEGEVFGFLGPNGAGKTTTVKLLNGMLRMTGGSCRVLGIDPFSSPEKAHAAAGVVTEYAQMYNNLTGLQNLLFFGAVFGLDAAESKRRALELLERLELTGAKDRKLAAYSTGMRQRLSLARAMLHRPRVLFLDEPTSGLDPESALSVNNLIKSLARDRGTTVFLCTHQLRYAEEICTSYGLISEGSMLAAGDLDELRSQVFSGMTVKLKIKNEELRIDNGKWKAHNEGEYLAVDVDSEDEIPLLVKQIVDGGGKVYHVSARRMSLEDIYFALIERRKIEGTHDAR
ncbi:MAG: ABC transporter ATP-binding protein [Treponema sp.]|nr:ABC transporter ATP-binding protein [Treponema sp.]